VRIEIDDRQHVGDQHGLAEDERRDRDRDRGRWWHSGTLQHQHADEGHNV